MDIKNLKPTRGKFKQGYFVPTNPGKYKGDLSKIIYRSNWERIFMRYCDAHPNVKQWASEPIYVLYVNPIDNKQHKYFIDFFIQVIQLDGSLKEYLVEVKPKSQHIIKENGEDNKPVFEGRKTIGKIKAYNQAMRTYIINSAKFAAAQEFAKSIGREFVIVTEDFLFNKGV